MDRGFHFVIGLVPGADVLAPIAIVFLEEFQVVILHGFRDGLSGEFTRLHSAGDAASRNGIDLMRGISDEYDIAGDKPVHRRRAGHAGGCGVGCRELYGALPAARSGGAAISIPLQ